MTSRLVHVATLLFATCALLQKQADAVVLDMDTVLGPNHPYASETITIVDGVNPPTEVDILEGALIGGLPGQSTVSIGLDMFGISRVTMFGGRVKGRDHAVRLNEQSVFAMFAGEIDTASIDAFDDSTVILNGGTWIAVEGHDSSRLVINGGLFAETFSVRTFGESHAVLNDAFLSFVADESSTAVVNGGVYERAEAIGNAEILVNGGHYVVGIRAGGNSVVRLRAVDGFADEPLVAQDDGVIHIYGTGLEFKVIDDHGTLRNIVAGKLADGDSFGAEYKLFDQGQIILHEVPEPASWALLAAAAVGVWLARRWR